MAILQAPGVLAVKVVDWESGRTTIGTEAGKPVPRKEILEALDAIGYSGTFADE